jgi:hypothetical protein
MIQYISIGLCDHAAFDHVRDLSGTMTKYASVYLEAADAVWKEPLTSGGNWDIGKGWKADMDDTLEPVCR